jgi:hypothetical protein
VSMSTTSARQQEKQRAHTGNSNHVIRLSTTFHAKRLKTWGRVHYLTRQERRSELPRAFQLPSL